MVKCFLIWIHWPGPQFTALGLFVPIEAGLSVEANCPHPVSKYSTCAVYNNYGSWQQLYYLVHAYFTITLHSFYCIE